MNGLGLSPTQMPAGTVAAPAPVPADPFGAAEQAALMYGQVMPGPGGFMAPVGAQMGGGDMAARLPAAAAELAKVMPPPQGSLTQMMAMMGAVKPGDDTRKLEAQLASRHYVNPPVSGGGGKPDAVGMPAYQQKMGAGGRGPKGLGEYLRGG